MAVDDPRVDATLAFDASSALDEPVSFRVPAGIVAGAEQRAGCPVAVYVIDLDGSCLIRLAGEEAIFPERIAAPFGVGPELPLEALPGLRRVVASELAGATVTPLVLRERALAVLVCRGEPAASLDALAGQAVLALELGSGYGDVVHAARRRKTTKPAAEIQQNLLPPRLTRVEGAQLAGGVLPGYEVGGDFFDYADNGDGLWLTVGDAMGKGNNAAALSALTVGALRAARRGGDSLVEVAHGMHEAVRGTGDVSRFVTAIVGVLDRDRRVLRYINLGHPPPLLMRPDGTVRELPGARTYPLGIIQTRRRLQPAEATLDPGDRLVMYSDGLSERRRCDRTLFGVEGIVEAIRPTARASAATTVRALQSAAVGVSDEPLRDDATLLVIALDPSA